MELLYTLIREKVTEKQDASKQVAAEIVSGMIRGSKYWTIEMVSDDFCQDSSLFIGCTFSLMNSGSSLHHFLPKPVRISARKSFLTGVPVFGML
jgi:hypothetical protein